MIEKIDILMLYEHVARELDVLCALKYFLERAHGLRVEIMQQPLRVPDALARFQPRAVVLPFTYSDSITSYPLLYDWLGARYVNFAWEEIFYAGNRDAKLPRGEFETRFVLHHAWGQFFVEILKQVGVPEKNIFLNGNPTYQLYREPYRRYFETRGELARAYNLDPARRWVFFPENYNWAFYPEWRLNDLAKAGLERDNMAAMSRFCRESLQEVLRWCGAATDSAGVELIIRPRPATPLDQFRATAEQMLGRSSRQLHFIKDKSIREWIMASDLVFSSYSTSLIEAAAAGKPVFMVEPQPIPNSLSADWHQRLPHLKTEQEFVTLCAGEMSWRDSRLGDWARSEMLARGDPIWNFGELLAGICLGKLKRPSPTRASVLLPPRNWLRAWRDFERKRTRGFAKRRKRLGANHPDYEHDVVADDEIAARVKRWSSVLANYPPSEFNPQDARFTAPLPASE